MLRLTLEKRTFIIVGIFTAFSIIVFASIIYPTMRYIDEINNETHDLRTYLQKKSDMAMALHSSQPKINKIRSTVAVFPQYLFRAGDELNLIMMLEKISAKNHVSQKIEGSNWDRPTEQQLSISLNVAGDYINTLQYLSDLENLNYFLITEQMQMSTLFNPTRPMSASSTALRLKLNLYVNP